MEKLEYPGKTHCREFQTCISDLNFAVKDYQCGHCCSTVVDYKPYDPEVVGSNLARCWAFFLAILSNVSLNRSLVEVQHHCFPKYK